MNILLIDNRDSFTFNLGEACKRQGAYLDTVRNDVGASEALERARSNNAIIVISPGPGRPEEAGCCLELAARAKGIVPLLGICLGHQVMLLEAGSEITTAPEIVHGKSSLVHHDGVGPFAGIPSPLRVGRYHSLCSTQPPHGYAVHAKLDGMMMAISNTEARQIGLQFHPESILTPLGDEVLGGCLRWLEASHA